MKIYFFLRSDWFIVSGNQLSERYFEPYCQLARAPGFQYGSECGNLENSIVIPAG
jgi:hypothetical protein